MEQLRNQGFEMFLPYIKVKKKYRGRVREVTEPMFPRYLFLHMDKARTNTAPIRSTLGVVGMVRFGNRQLPVPESFMQLLLQQCNEQGLYEGYRQPEPDLNTEVEIVEGPFAGLKGILQARSAQERVVILINIMGGEKAITMPSGHIMS